MLNRFKTEDEGFTLIELLVVILIIGILAAIALPSFLGQQKKAQDSSAKSDARNAVSQIESCFADEQNYDNCKTALAKSGLPATVTIAATGPTSYTITATSKSGNSFSVVKKDDGTSDRTCDKGGDYGCPASGKW